MTPSLIKRSLLAAAIAASFPVHAQIAPDDTKKTDDKPTAQLETVTVTANRRSENIKDVPVSVSALKGEKLDVINSAGADIRMLAARVPSLNIESSYGRAFPRFYIRGLGNTDFDLNASQPVSLVFDEIVQENPILKGFPVFDLDQIEVLRGPQGTLFGRNSPAGVIKFNSAKPTQRFEGYLNASYATHQTVNVEGALNVPLNPDWAMRLSLQTQHRDDWVHNTVKGPTQDYEGYNDTAARLQFMYQPSTDFSALFNVHGRDLKGSARLFRANIIKKGSNDLVDGFRADQVSFDAENHQQLSSDGANVHLRWNRGGLTLHSVTGYEHVDTYSRGDIDGGFGASFAPPMGPGFIPFPAASADGLPSHRQFSQEFRAESNQPGPLSWVAGMYYFNEDITIDSFDYDTLGGGKLDGYAQQHQNNKAWAVFGSANYAFTEQWKVRAGLRYTDDRKDFYAQRFVSPIGAGATQRLTAKPSDTNVSWDLSSTYALNADTNVYARIATGFRAPSIQGRLLFGDTLSVGQSETVLSYEAGVKQELFGRRARLSANVFRYRIKDMQLTAVGGTANFNRLINADKAVGQGFELDLQANLSDALQLTVGGSYNDTEIRDRNLSIAACGSGCTVRDPAAACPAPSRSTAIRCRRRRSGSATSRCATRRRSPAATCSRTPTGPTARRSISSCTTRSSTPASR
jgi:iron complex outermembrane receptor protein